MAESNKIKSSEIIEPNIFGNSTSSAKEFYDMVLKLEKGLEDLAKTQEKIFKETKLDSSENINKVTAALEENKKTTISITEVKKQKAALDAKEIAANQIAKKDFNELVKLRKAEIILLDKTRGAEEKLLASNTVLRQARKDLIYTDKNYEINLKRINLAIDKNNAEMVRQSDQFKKQRLNVGNYSNSIKDALGQTGLFNGQIGLVINSLKGIKESISGATGGASKLKVGLLGLASIGVIGLIAGLTALAKMNQKVMDGFDELIAGAKDLALSFIGINGTFHDTVVLLREIRYQNFKLTIDMVKLTTQAGNLKLISEDTTLSWQERNKAAEEYEVLQNKINDTAKVQAELALKAARAERNKFLVANGGDPKSVPVDVEKAFIDAQVNLANAIDKRDQFIYDEIPKKRRERRDKELAEDLDYLRSKKKAATGEIDALELQVNDVNKQLEDREQALKDFNRLNKEVFNEQIKLFKERTGIAVDAEKLLALTDGIALSREIKRLKLGETNQASLTTVIVKQQKAQTAGLRDIEVLELARIQRAKQLAKIEADRAKIIRDDLQNDIQIELKKAQIEEARLKDIAAADSSRKNIDNLKEQYTIEEDLNNKLFDIQRENLKGKLEEDKKVAEAEIVDKVVLKEKLIFLEEQYNIDLENLEQEQSDKTIELAKKTTEELGKISKQRTADAINELSKFTQAVSTEIDRREKIQEDAYNIDSEKRKESITRQEELARDGYANQLAFERAQQAKEELARKDAIEKAQRDKERALLVEAYFNAFNKRLQDPNTNSGQAAFKAFSDVLVAKSTSKLLQYAHDGNEWVQALPGQHAPKGVDSIPFMLAPEEGVVTAEANNKHRGVVGALNKGTFSDLYIPKARFNEAARDIRQSATLSITNKLLGEYTKQTKLLEDIKSKPIQMVDVDGLGNLINTVYQNGIKTVTVHKQRTKL